MEELNPPHREATGDYFNSGNLPDQVRVIISIKSTLHFARLLRKVTSTQPRLPDNLPAKPNQSSALASEPARVKLILKNGRTIYDVFVSKDGVIVRAGGSPVYREQDLRFRPSDIVEVLEY